MAEILPFFCCKRPLSLTLLSLILNQSNISPVILFLVLDPYIVMCLSCNRLVVSKHLCSPSSQLSMSQKRCYCHEDLAFWTSYHTLGSSLYHNLTSRPYFFPRSTEGASIMLTSSNFTIKCELIMVIGSSGVQFSLCSGPQLSVSIRFHPKPPWSRGTEME